MTDLASFSDPREELISHMSEGLMRAQIGSLYLSVKQYAGGLRDGGAAAQRLRERFLRAAEAEVMREPVPVIDTQRRARLLYFFAFGAAMFVAGACAAALWLAKHQ